MLKNVFTLSIVVPVYNAEAYLKESIDSLLSQTYPDFEIILINDGSKDRSGDICESYKKKDSRIRVYHQQNQGVNRTLNFGIDQSQGEWIGRHDADDWSKPNRFERQIQYLRKNPDVKLLGTGCEIIDREGTVQQAWIVENHEQIVEILPFLNVIPHGSVIFHKKSFEAIGKYPDRIGSHYCEDYEAWICFASRYRVGILPEPLYCYRKHEASVSSVSFSAQLEQARAIGRSVFETDTFKKMRSISSYHMWRLWPDWRRACFRRADYRAKASYALCLSARAHLELSRLAPALWRYFVAFTIDPTETIRALRKKETRFRWHDNGSWVDGD
jgi:glycosyltransferase involved in cell wall biosynthesis